MYREKLLAKEGDQEAGTVMRVSELGINNFDIEAADSKP